MAAGAYHPSHPSSPTLVEMYQNLRTDYKELEEDHDAVVKQNVSLVRSIGELERALASARVGRSDAESNPVRELREANAKLREELREKTLQVGWDCALCVWTVVCVCVCVCVCVGGH
jgi:hypothetical protein